MDSGLPRCARAPELQRGDSAHCRSTNWASHDWAAPSSRPRALIAVRVEIDRAVRDREAEGRPDGAFDEANLAAVRARQFGHDGKAEPDAAGAGRALERFEQMRARFLRKPGAGVGDLDHHHRALAPARDANLIAAGVLALARLERLHRVAREIEQHAEELVGIGV